MGKSERETIRDLEDSVASVLNGAGSTLPRSHVWAEHDEALARRIASDYPIINKASAEGDTYAGPGDLTLELDSRPKARLELKASKSKAGKGTAANITQDALTNYGLFPETESWSCYRKRVGFDAALAQILDRYARAKNEATIELKGRLIRDDAQKGSQQAARVRRQAVALADSNRKAYMAEIQGQSIDVEAVRFFCLAIVMGAHTAAGIAELAERGLPTSPSEVPSDYGIYYTNLKGSNIVVSHLGRDAVVDLLSFDEFSVQLGTDTKATCSIQGERDGSSLELLTFILHWKNVFLGIKTPCINVFLGRHTATLIS